MTFLDANLNELKTKVFNMNEEKQSFLRSGSISDTIQNEYEKNKDLYNFLLSRIYSRAEAIFFSFSFRFSSTENFKKYHNDFRKELKSHALLCNS